MKCRLLCLFAAACLFAANCPIPLVRAGESGEATAAKVTISIDAARVGEPISKYVYGQFIEHLGRCIYGGIWAEMLDDRKFFHPVGKGESPWKAIGGREAATMVREAAFVGEHSPRITLAGDEPRGIEQRGLGLVEGKTYTGRIWLSRSKPGPASVSLVWGEASGDRQTVTIPSVGGEFSKAPFQFRAGRSTADARLEITALGEGTLAIGAVSLMPADNVCGMRADTLALLKELDAPVYRWPGGNFVSGYDWHDGLGDPDRRAPRKNPAWQGVEHNDFGIDEYMNFCRLLGADPYITVNSGLGGVQTAVEEVEYANAPATAPWASFAPATATPRPMASASGRSATRCTAAGNSVTCPWKSTSRRTTNLPQPCGPWMPRSSWLPWATWDRGAKEC